MEKSELLNLEIRRKLFNYIKDNPGLHLHELARKIDMSYHNLRYHLSHLEKHDLVVLKSNKSYTHVYPKENLSKREKEIFSVVRQETPRNILLVLINYIITSQNDLSELLDKHPTTIEHHLKKLQELNLIQNVEVKDGKAHATFRKTCVFIRDKKANEKVYALNDFGLVLRIFMTYRKSLEDDEFFKFALQRWIDRFHETQKEKQKERHDLKQWMDERIDSVIKIFFDIFPPPFVS